MFACCHSKTSKKKKKSAYNHAKTELEIPTIKIDTELGINDTISIAQMNNCIVDQENDDNGDSIKRSSTQPLTNNSSTEFGTIYEKCSEPHNNTVKLVANDIPSNGQQEVYSIDHHADEVIEQSTDSECKKDDGTEFPAKSCMSRHNSSHMSTKKKVNISSYTEVIEDNAQSTPFVERISLGDDDDVFSDSLPPQKRESLCAPYIEQSDYISEANIFSHGLPEWFNDERLNEIGCVEPPVTPVGRDELELRRQRLYGDLLRAAHAAVEHNVRYTRQEPDVALNSFNSRIVGDLKYFQPSNTAEDLYERFEKLVDRLEKVIYTQELLFGNTSFGNSFVKSKDRIDLESEISPVNSRCQSTENNLESKNLEIISEENPSNTDPKTIDFANNMSVPGYEDIINGPLTQYLTLSSKIGADVAKHAELVKAAFAAQLEYVKLASQCSRPSQEQQMELLKPTSTQISAIQDYREKHRASPYFNHLSAISESIPALGWVCVSPTPGPHVKEMNDAGQFYTNRVLKEWKEKDATHVEWARAWIQTLTELQAFIKQYHTTGLVWSGKSAASAGKAPPPPPPMGSCPPPPPPPTFDLNAMSLDNAAGDERSALFAEINQGEAITKNLKKVTADMQTHKNPTLRTGPAPFKKPTEYGTQKVSSSSAVNKEPLFTRDGKKWLIEYQIKNPKLIVDNAEMNNVIYMYKCEGSTLTVKGKVNNIVLDSCKKCSLLFDSVVASIEFVNCQSVQMQVLGFVPTISVDKTDGCQMYLSKDSMQVEIVSSKSSEMNVMLPEANGDYTELAIPEQFKTTISGKTLKTICVDSLG